MGLVYTDALLREPRLLIPRMAPLSTMTVDDACPFVAGLIDCCLPVGKHFYSPRYKNLSVNAGTPLEIDVHPNGPAVRAKTTSVTTQYEYLKQPIGKPLKQGAGCLTVMAVCYTRQAVVGQDPTQFAGNWILGFSVSGTTLGLSLCAGGSYYLALGSSLGSNRGGTTSQVMAANRVYVAWGYHTAADSICRAHLDFNAPVAIGAANTPSWTNAQTGFYVGNANSTSAPGDKCLLFGAAWNRQLSDYERKALTVDPFQLVKPA